MEGARLHDFCLIRVQFPQCRGSRVCLQRFEAQNVQDYDGTVLSTVGHAVFKLHAGLIHENAVLN